MSNEADAATNRDGERAVEPAGHGGHRIIIVLYVIVVGVAGLMGTIIGTIGPRDLQAVSFLGLVTFQPTPLGLALFGMSTVALGLGAVIVLVVAVSRRYAS